ncbi:MAG: iron-sulfur cluster carrier protein MrpORP [Kiritimatiellia bacterium]
MRGKPTCGNDSGKETRQQPSGAQAETLDDFLENEVLRDRLDRIQYKIMVMSGKGGVGKSTVAVNMAVALALAGRRVGLLDVDIHGPSIPKMLHLDEARAQAKAQSLLPVEHAGIKIMSVGFLLSNRDDAIIWRGPMKMSVIRQFLKDVEWGDLDYLIIDAPPGTGDEPLTVAQLAAPVDGAVIVTTPQEVATADVRKSINFCRQLNLPVLGVIENMSGFACPTCGAVADIFKSGGGERMAGEMQAPFLGRIPIDPKIAQACDDGAPFVYHYSRTETAQAMEKILAPILAMSDGLPAADNATHNKHAGQPAQAVKKNGGSRMKIAIPVAGGKLCMHFGHCEQFALIEADEASKKIIGQQFVTPPPHEPGVLPQWLHEQGAQVIIAGGMGRRAQQLFIQNEIKVIVGADAAEPERVVQAFLEGTLTTGANVCDH